MTLTHPGMHRCSTAGSVKASQVWCWVDGIHWASAIRMVVSLKNCYDVFLRRMRRLATPPCLPMVFSRYAVCMQGQNSINR